MNSVSQVSNTPKSPSPNLLSKLGTPLFVLGLLGGGYYEKTQSDAVRHDPNYSALFQAFKNNTAEGVLTGYRDENSNKGAQYDPSHVTKYLIIKRDELMKNLCPMGSVRWNDHMGQASGEQKKDTVFCMNATPTHAPIDGIYNIEKKLGDGEVLLKNDAKYNEIKNTITGPGADINKLIKDRNNRLGQICEWYDGVWKISGKTVSSDIVCIARK